MFLALMHRRLDTARRQQRALHERGVRCDHAARLRQRVSARTAALIVESIMRRQDLEPAARAALFLELATHLKNLTPFPAEATDGIGDEQYVRNVADVLFR